MSDGDQDDERVARLIGRVRPRKPDQREPVEQRESWAPVGKRGARTFTLSWGPDGGARLSRDDE